MQDIYNPCPCGSGKKFKFCCRSAARDPGLKVVPKSINTRWAKANAVPTPPPILTLLENEKIPDELFELLEDIVEFHAQASRREVLDEDFEHQIERLIRPAPTLVTMGILQFTVNCLAKRAQSGKEEQILFAMLHLAFFNLRTSLERKRPEAKILWANIQQALATEIIPHPECGEATTMIVSAMNHACLDKGRIIDDALDNQEIDENLAQGPEAEEFARVTHNDPSLMLAELLKLAETSNPFELAEFLRESTSAHPLDLRLTFLVAALSSRESLHRDVGLLWGLDNNPKLRTTLWETLSANEIQLSKQSYHRIVAVRNWLPEEDRVHVDQIVRRGKNIFGTAEAPVERKIEAMMISLPDGAGAVGIHGLARHSGICSPFGLILKCGVGIVDCFVHVGAGEKKAQRFYTESPYASMSTKTQSQAFLEVALPRFLKVMREQGKLAPRDLLFIGEIIGATPWHPGDERWHNVLIQLRSSDAFVAACDTLEVERLAHQWFSSHSFTESWFEDDVVVDNLLLGTKSFRGNFLIRLEKKALSEIIIPRLDRWIEILECAAVVSSFNESGASVPQAGFFAGVAEHLRHCSPASLKKHPLLRRIALQTVQSLCGRFMQDSPHDLSKDPYLDFG